MRPQERFLVVAGAVGLLAVAIQASGLVEQTELDSIDTRFALRGEQPVRDDVALVLVDDVTLSELDEQRPLPRARHAAVVKRLRQDGARLIAYDLVFSDPERGCKPTVDPDARACDGDAALLEEVDRARPTVFAVTESDPIKGPKLFGGGPIIEMVGALPGTVALPSDRGGVLRRVVWGDAGIPSFATAVSQVIRKRPIAPEQYPSDGEALIDYAGRPGTYRATSFSRVLRGQFKKGTFYNKIVIVGTDDPTQQDVHPVPTSRDRVMSGAEIQAHAIATVLDGFPLRQAPDWLAIILSGLLGALVSLVAAVASFRATVIAGVATAAGWPAIVHWQFHEGLVLPLVAPLAGLALGILGTVGTHALVQSLERTRTRATFERFVGAAVVDEVLREAGGEARLGGRRAVGTVLFADLRGFTTFAEHLDPDEVITVLNVYLTGMSDAILDHGGTLVSYLGDGIMAVFGAPIAQEDHADRALDTALEMTGPTLTRCNAVARARGHKGEFLMGVALNTGIVMSGTVGSARRMEYTALGDTTNAASRIEPLTATLGCAVLLTDATRNALCKAPPELTDQGEHQLRGRSAPLRLWAVTVDD